MEDKASSENNIKAYGAINIDLIEDKVLSFKELVNKRIDEKVIMNRMENTVLDYYSKKSFDDKYKRELIAGTLNWMWSEYYNKETILNKWITHDDEYGFKYIPDLDSIFSMHELTGYIDDSGKTHMIMLTYDNSPDYYFYVTQYDLVLSDEDDDSTSYPDSDQSIVEVKYLGDLSDSSKYNSLERLLDKHDCDVKHLVIMDINSAYSFEIDGDKKNVNKTKSKNAILFIPNSIFTTFVAHNKEKVALV